MPVDVPSKVKPTQPSVTSQMVMHAVKPPPWIIVLLKVPTLVSEEQYTSYGTTFSSTYTELLASGHVDAWAVGLRVAVFGGVEDAEIVVVAVDTVDEAAGRFKFASIATKV